MRHANSPQARLWLFGKWLAYAPLRWGVRPVRDLLRTLRGTHPIRIFTYHRLSEGHRDGMTLTPRLFRRQMEYIGRYHEVITLETALALLAAGVKLRRPRAVITFDDAYLSVYELAYPLLCDLGIPACCFVATQRVGLRQPYAHDLEGVPEMEARTMEWDHLARLRESGWTVGSHSATHARLSECDAPAARMELERSRSDLLERLGLQALVLAYPFGGPNDINEETRRLAADVGYLAVLSNSGASENFPGDDLFRLGRADLGGPHADCAWKAWAHGMTLGFLKSARRRARSRRRPEGGAAGDGE